MIGMKMRKTLETDVRHWTSAIMNFLEKSDNKMLRAGILDWFSICLSLENVN